MSGVPGARWRRRVLFGIVAISPALLVITLGLERQRRRGLDAAGVAFRLGEVPERCLACHQREARAMPTHHAPRALGCSTCHLGNPASLDKQRAHAGLERFPGDLSTAWRSCGGLACHPAAVARVQRSLMATARGILAVNRLAFGEMSAPGAVPRGWNRPTGVASILPPASSAEAHARKLCAGCHLATRHASRAVRSRGGGCSACHLKPGLTNDAHPQLRLGVSPEVCTGCHSRSGRIALSYYGWHEGVAEPGHGPVKTGVGALTMQRRLPDGRVVRRARADVHARAGMTCLDCHTATGLMGDGERHGHKEQQVDIACTDCHAPSRFGAIAPQEEATLRIARYLVRRRIIPSAAVGTVVARTARSTALLALRPGATDGWVLHRRVDGRTLKVSSTPSDAAHSLRGHERLTCQACHTDWSHQCYGCHTRRDPDGRQWDSVTGTYTPGRWVETPGPMLIDAPTLGVLPGGSIGPFVPGMPLCVERRGSQVCRRLFAPADPHTTQRRSRSCASCHQSTRSLGLGRGKAVRDRGRWRFQRDPQGPPAGTHRMPIPPWSDGVGWDGWTTLAGSPLARATRPGARPLSRAEMLRILEVGRCVGCHKLYTDPIYRDFGASLSSFRSGGARRCALRRASSIVH